MAIQDLQKFIEENCKDACKPVDLIKIARGLALSQAGKRKGPNRLCLIVDSESCLDRLYGGFYSDWACGGQWNRMNQFLGTLIDACIASHMELLVYFNGAFECSRLQDWSAQQQIVRKNASNVIKHINNKATPPPKVWWIPPVALRSSIRMALRQWGVPVATSMEDHHQEVMVHCRENGFHGVVADNSDYAIFGPPRYFSSQNLKLTYKGALETVEFDMDAVAKSLDLHPTRFAVLAAVMGSHLLSERDLQDFYFKVCNVSVADELKKMNSTDIIKAILEFVRVLESIDDLDAVGKEVFGTETHKIAKFKQTVRYYMNGTEEYLMKFRREVRAQARSNQFGARVNGSNGGAKRDSKKMEEKVDWDGVQNKEEVSTDIPADSGDSNGDLKSESVHLQHESGYASSLGADTSPSSATPEIVIEPPSLSEGGDADEAASDADKVKDSSDTTVVNENETVAEHVDEEVTADSEVKVEQNGEKEEAESTKETDESAASPSTEKTAEQEAEEKEAEQKEKEAREKEKAAKNKEDKDRRKAERKERERKLREQNKHMYKLSQDALKIARDRHSKGFMHPWICQILMQQEIRIDCTLEDENSRDLPAICDLFRPIRQSVYAILFDYNKRMLIHRNSIKEAKENKDAKEPGEKPSVVVKEWVLPRGSTVPQADAVSAVELEWLVPGLHRLWLGQMPDDKSRRLRAFLSSLNSDVPLMLNTTFVPQHLIVLCAVLRYVIKFRDQRVLRKHELDAFLCTAVSPLLRDVETMQEMKLPALTARGVQLGSIFMQGAEHAMVVNDACGAPVPWGMTCPWNFFDGKLFHFKLLKANNNPHLIDLCDGQMDQVMRVERMRQAILQDVPLDLVFAKPPLPLMGQQPGSYMPPGGASLRPGGAGPHPQGNGRAGRGSNAMVNGSVGHGPGQVDARGGQLQIAGVVISNWGPNMPAQQQKQQRGGRGDAPPPQVTSVGPRRGGARPVVSSPALRGRGMPGRPGMGMRGGAMSNRGQGPRGPPFQGNNFYNNMRGGGNPAGPVNPSNYQQHMHHGYHSSPMRGGHRGGMHGPPQNGIGRSNRGGHSGHHNNGMKHISNNSMKPVTLEQRMKSPGGARGRGGTVETQHDGGNCMPVSQLMKDPGLHFNPAQLHQQQAAVAQSTAAAVAASQAQQLAAATQAAQSQAHQLSSGHMMSVSAHNQSYGGPPGQVSMSQAPHHTHMPPVSLNHSQLPPHMNLSQNQMTHGQLQSQAQMGTHVQGLINAAQISIAAISDMNLGHTAAGQMQQLSLNGQTDFGHYATNMPTDLSSLGPNDLGMITPDFGMQHMNSDRMGMFDMNGGDQ